MSKTVLFYSSVKTKKMFSVQSYYRNDILILRDLGYEVSLSNRVFDFFLFWKYDLSFLYFYRYSFIAAFLSKCFRKKVYFTGGIDALDRNAATCKQRYIQKILFKVCNLFSDTSILVSKTDQCHVQDIYHGRLPSNCVLSFHSIDFEKFEFTGDFTSKKNIFVTIAWMVSLENVYRKGVDKAIRVFSSIKRLIPDYKFYVIGPSGEGSCHIERLISELSLEDAVIYLGTIEEDAKIRLLKDSRFYFQLSTYEGFGIAAIEALAAGCQVIHSGRGGLQDGIGNYGYKTNINHEDEIAALVLELCKKECDAKRLNEGISYVKEHFSYKARLNDFKEIIEH